MLEIMSKMITSFFVEKNTVDFNTLNMFDSLHHGYMWAS